MTTGIDSLLLWNSWHFIRELEHDISVLSSPRLVHRDRKPWIKTLKKKNIVHCYGKNAAAHAKIPDIHNGCSVFSWEKMAGPVHLIIRKMYAPEKTSSCLAPKDNHPKQET